MTLGKLASEKSHDVVIIDRKDHIGGNCFDYFDENSIDIHAYGTHIFHTDEAEVWRFLSQFTQWYPYQHEVKALVDGQLVPVPFNFNSIEQLFPKQMAERMIAAIEAMRDSFDIPSTLPHLSPNDYTEIARRALKEANPASSLLKAKGFFEYS